MYKSVFQSSKVALLFAAMTLISAVSMIGTEEDRGVLTETVERIEERAAESGGASQHHAATGGAGTEEGPRQPVFGDYVPAQAPAQATGAAAAGYAGPMNAPLSPTAVVIPNGAPLPPELSGEEPSAGSE